jgi:ketosteroid isomerase-like protein
MTEIKAIIEAVYAAVGAGDGAKLTELLADDLEYVVPGGNRFAGTHRGRDEFFAIMGELGALTGGTLRNIPQQMFFGSTGAVVIQQTTAERDGRKYDLLDALTIEVKDGQVTAVIEYAGNPDEFEQFLA